MQENVNGLQDYLKAMFSRFCISKRRAYFVHLLLSLATALSLSLLIHMACLLLFTLAWQLSLGVFALVFTGIFYYLVPTKPSKLSVQSFLTALELKFPNARHSFWHPSKESEAEALEEWHSLWESYVKEQKRSQRLKIKSRVGSLLSPLALSLVFLAQDQPSLLTSLGELRGAVQSQVQPGSLRILQGQADQEKPSSFKLRVGKVAKLDLVLPNLVELQLNLPQSSEQPVAYLYDPSSEKYDLPLQSFKLQASEQRGQSSATLTYQVTFAVSRSSVLKISTFSEKLALASFKVDKPPAPELSLATTADLSKPWHDEEAMPLHIRVSSQIPLHEVHLRIGVDGQWSDELVKVLSTSEVLTYEGEYNVLLEPYVNSDLATVELVAEASDTAQPVVHIGRSSTLLVHTASAYGRYQKTLKKLSELKAKLDKSLTTKQAKLDSKVVELGAEALASSGKTPFFDSQDRMQLQGFADSLEKLRIKPNFTKLVNTATQVDEFLVEHETLDDRERDRDFFVALRALARQVSEPLPAPSRELSMLLENLNKYLENRKQRWSLRVARLHKPEKLKEWQEIRDHSPFVAALKRIAELEPELMEAKGKQKALQVLATTVARYRTWIEALEALEDEEKETLNQEREKGLVGLRKTLRELQVKQGKISQNLDAASSKEQLKKLPNDWPALRMHQTTNLARTQGVEKQLQAVVPQAGARLQAAAQAMQLTLSFGEEADFREAETYADLAGRLLRQAEAESSKPQNGKGRRRRRPVSGDRYYGQTISGGEVEIQRDYQVDKRYREDLLDEVQASPVSSEEDSKLLEDYVRRLIR